MFLCPTVRVHICMCVNTSNETGEAAVPDSCLFNVDIVTSGLCQHNIDTSLLGVPLVRRKLSIGQSMVSWTDQCFNCIT